MSPSIAKRMRDVKPSLTKAMTQRARVMAAEGIDVIALSQGELDFDTPLPVRAAGIRAIETGMTRYTEVAGVQALRTAIAGKLRRDQGLAYGVDQITVGCGAKQVLFNALYCILDTDSECVFPMPCWVSYPEMVTLAGGIARAIETREENRWILTPARLEAALSSKTRALLLNSPCNPTGVVYSHDELRALAVVLRDHPDVWILSDEIYEPLVYGSTRFASFGEVAPDLLDRIVVINGVSKSAAMTGWRVGYGAGPKALIAAMNSFQSQTTSHTSSISQYAAIEALDGDQSHLERFRQSLQERRDLICGRLEEIPGLRLVAPEGAFYVFVNVAGLIGKRTPDGRELVTDMDVALYWLECGVAGVPGVGFMASPYVRLSFAATTSDIVRACQRIAAACSALL